MKKYVIYILLFFLVLKVAYATIPDQITMQQILRDRTTGSLETGIHVINYSIIRLSDDSVLWNETISANFTDGKTSNIWGLTQPILKEYFFNPVYWQFNIDNDSFIIYNESAVGTAKVAEYALEIAWNNITGQPFSFNGSIISDANFSCDSTFGGLFADGGAQFADDGAGNCGLMLQWISTNTTLTNLTYTVASADITPNINNTFDLGNESNWWSFGYIYSLFVDSIVLNGETLVSDNQSWNETRATELFITDSSTFLINGSDAYFNDLNVTGELNVDGNATFNGTFETPCLHCEDGDTYFHGDGFFEGNVTAPNIEVMESLIVHGNSTCSGTANPCGDAIFIGNPALCGWSIYTGQRGCRWRFFHGDCVGTATPCDEMSTATCEVQHVCTLTTGAAGFIIDSLGLSGNFSINTTGNIIAGEIFAKFSGNSSMWNRTGTDVILANTGDNVGIGTINPGASLDVNGTVHFDRRGTGNSASLIMMGDEDGDNYKYSIIQLTDDLNDKKWLLEHRSLASNHSFYIEYYNGSVYYVPFKIEPETPANTLFLEDTGNVGIGTADPKARLDINGTLNVSSWTNSTQYCFGDGTCIDDWDDVNQTLYYPNATVDNLINGNNSLSLHLTQDNWYNDSGGWINWDGDSPEFNFSKLSTIYFNATQSAIIAGTIDGGSLNDTWHIDKKYDGISFNFSEDSGSPGLDVRINFTNIESFNEGVIRYKTSSLNGIYPIIQLINYDTGLWEDYPPLGQSILSWKTIEQSVFDSTEHVNVGGVVQMRLYKASNGNTNNHYYVDWISISKGYGTPSPDEVDSLSIHRDGNTTLISNWNVGNYTIYNATFNGTFNGVWNGSDALQTLIRNERDANFSQFYPNATVDALIGGNLSLAYTNDTNVLELAYINDTTTLGTAYDNDTFGHSNIFSLITGNLSLAYINDTSVLTLAYINDTTTLETAYANDTYGHDTLLGSAYANDTYYITDLDNNMSLTAKLASNNIFTGIAQFMNIAYFWNGTYLNGMQGNIVNTTLIVTDLSGAIIMIFNGTSGEVGIGTPIPAYNLDVNGTIGSGTITTTGDINLPNGIITNDATMEIIMGIDNAGTPDQDQLFIGGIDPDGGDKYYNLANLYLYGKTITMGDPTSADSTIDINGALGTTGNIGVIVTGPAQIEIDATGAASVLKLDSDDDDTIVSFQEGDTAEFTIMHDQSESKFQIRDGGLAGTEVFSIEDGANLNTLYLDSDGKIGIGTDTPESELSVIGDINASVDLHVMRDIYSYDDIIAKDNIYAKHNLYVGTAGDPTNYGIVTAYGRSVSSSGQVRLQNADNLDTNTDYWGLNSRYQTGDFIIQASLGAQGTKSDIFVIDDTTRDVKFNNSVLYIDMDGFVGIGTDTPTYELTVVGNSSFGGHILSTGTAPTLGTCGSIPGTIGVNSTDTRGSVLVGTDASAVTSCAFTFAVPYTIPPICMVDSNQNEDIEATETTTGVTFVGTDMRADTIDWICIG